MTFVVNITIILRYFSKVVLDENANFKKEFIYCKVVSINMSFLEASSVNSHFYLTLIFLPPLFNMVSIDGFKGNDSFLL